MANRRYRSYFITTGRLEIIIERWITENTAKYTSSIVYSWPGRQIHYHYKTSRAVRQYSTKHQSKLYVLPTFKDRIALLLGDNTQTQTLNTRFEVTEVHLQSLHLCKHGLLWKRQDRKCHFK